MAKRKAAKRRTAGSEIPYGIRNYQIFFAGLAFIVIGYILMWNSEVYSQQALTVSILFLTIGYVILIPLAIIYIGNKKQQNETS